MKARYWINSIFVALLPLSQACNMEPAYKDAVRFSWEDFGTPVILKGEVVHLDEPLERPIGIRLVDSIILFENFRTEKFITKYHLYKKAKTGACFSFGSGPGEVLSIAKIQICDSSIWILDDKKRQFSGYDKAGLCLTDTAMPVKQIKFEDTFEEGCVLPDGRIVASSVRNRKYKRLVFYDRNGEFINTEGELPDYGERMTPLEMIEGNITGMAMKEDGSRICVVNKLSDLLEIYDNKGKLIVRLHGPDRFFPVVKQKEGNGFSRVSMMDSREAYFVPLAYKNNIYVLYSGKAIDPDDKLSRMRENLFVFDWDGNPVKRYELRNPVFRFVIDPKTDILYGLSDNPEFHLLKFKL